MLTGKLGEVIKESAQIALSFLKSNAFNLGLTQNVDDDLLNKRSIHLHMPCVLSSLLILVELIAYSSLAR